MLLENEIKHLVSAIIETNEFKNYKIAKANIDKYKDLKDEIESFQKKQMELYRMNMQSEKAKALASDLNRSFKKLSQIPEVYKLLSSGNNFSDMMFNVYKSIQDSLDKEFNK